MEFLPSQGNLKSNQESSPTAVEEMAQKSHYVTKTLFSNCAEVADPRWHWEAGWFVLPLFVKES